MKNGWRGTSNHISSEDERKIYFLFSSIVWSSKYQTGRKTNASCAVLQALDCRVQSTEFMAYCCYRLFLKYQKGKLYPFLLRFLLVAILACLDRCVLKIALNIKCHGVPRLCLTYNTSQTYFEALPCHDRSFQVLVSIFLNHLQQHYGQQ